MRSADSLFAVALALLLSVRLVAMLDSSQWHITRILWLKSNECHHLGLFLHCFSIKSPQYFKIEGSFKNLSCPVILERGPNSSTKNIWVGFFHSQCVFS